MPQGHYLPEGMLLETARNQYYTSSREGMAQAMESGAIVEGQVVLCDAAHNLVVDINGMSGVIKRKEAASGIESGQTREIAIISRVGKPVCFKVLGVEDGIYRLSRRQAQEEAMEHFMQCLEPGEVIRVRVTHLENFGVFADIGCGNISLLGIENISVSRISHPRERFYPKMDIFAVVLAKDRGLRRITLSHRELLGTWEENAALLQAGETVGGIVRGIEDYGIFVELTPNISGLSERRDGITSGMPVAVYIKSIIPERMKIKLIIIDALECVGKKAISDRDYFIKSGRLRRWRYTPENCAGKMVETLFESTREPMESPLLV